MKQHHSPPPPHNEASFWNGQKVASQRPTTPMRQVLVGWSLPFPHPKNVCFPLLPRNSPGTSMYHLQKRKHLGELYLVTSVFLNAHFKKKHVGIGVSLYSHGWCLTKFPKTPMASSLQNDQNPYLCRWWTWSFEASQHHLGGVEWLDLRSAGCKCSKGLILPARWAGPLPVTSRGP